MNNTPLTISEALEYLKSNICLISPIDGKLSYFRQVKDKVRVFNKNSSIIISYDDFVKLYRIYTFYVYDKQEDTIDYDRDAEYYSWTHK